jgi:hypothetical protein
MKLYNKIPKKAKLISVNMTKIFKNSLFFIKYVPLMFIKSYTYIYSKNNFLLPKDY